MLFKSFYKRPPDTSCLTIQSGFYQRFKILLLLPLKKPMNGDGVCPRISKWIRQSASILKSTSGQKVVSGGGMTSTDFSSSLRPLPPRWAGIFIRLRHLEPVELDRKIRTKPSERTPPEWTRGGLSLGSKLCWQHPALCHPDPGIIHPSGLLMSGYQVQ